MVRRVRMQGGSRLAIQDLMPADAEGLTDLVEFLIGFRDRGPQERIKVTTT